MENHVGNNTPGWETPTLLVIGMVSPLLQPGAKNAREPSDRRAVAFFPPFPVISRSVRKKL